MDDDEGIATADVRTTRRVDQSDIAFSRVEAATSEPLPVQILEVKAPDQSRALENAVKSNAFATQAEPKYLVPKIQPATHADKRDASIRTPRAMPAR